MGFLLFYSLFHLLDGDFCLLILPTQCLPRSPVSPVFPLQPCGDWFESTEQLSVRQHNSHYQYSCINSNKTIITKLKCGIYQSKYNFRHANMIFQYAQPMKPTVTQMFEKVNIREKNNTYCFMGPILLVPFTVEGQTLKTAFFLCCDQPFLFTS